MTAQLGFELAYFKAALQLINHYITRTNRLLNLTYKLYELSYLVKLDFFV